MNPARSPAQGPTIAALRRPLTRREMEVVDLLLEGLRPPQIAARLFRSESAVRSHVATACRKLGVTGQVGLIQAVRNGAARCTAETGVEVWDDDEANQDVRCTRPPGHEGRHAALIQWGPA